MGAVIRMPDRVDAGKSQNVRVRSARSTEQRFRHPGPDVVSEVSCHGGRRRARRDSERTARRAG